MERFALTLSGTRERARALEWVRNAPEGYRVEIKPPKRSDAQNDRMWAMLADLSKQARINGKAYQPDQWKVIFMRAMGKEAQFLPTLDGETFFPTGFRSSDLGTREMSDLQTLMQQWGDEQGVLWSDPREIALRAQFETERT